MLAVEDSIPGTGLELGSLWPYVGVTELREEFLIITGAAVAFASEVKGRWAYKPQTTFGQMKSGLEGLDEEDFSGMTF